MNSLISTVGFILILIGLWGILTRKHIIRMIIGFSIMDTGVHLILIGIGYLPGREAPIFGSLAETADAVNRVVDPIPSALVLTAIVIGLAVTALLLSFAVRMAHAKKSLSIDKFKEQKW